MVRPWTYNRKVGGSSPTNDHHYSAPRQGMNPNCYSIAHGPESIVSPHKVEIGKSLTQVSDVGPYWG